MKALVYHGANAKAWEEKPMPSIIDSTDAIVRISKTTMCGTDLHIMKGDVPEVTDGRILGHEGVGVIEETGTAVTGLRRHGLRAAAPRLSADADTVEVTNEVRPRSSTRPSSGLGLVNLDERCRLLTGRALEVHPAPEPFTVRVPLLPSRLPGSMPVRSTPAAEFSP